jgi:hypothetical protein
MTCRGLPLTRGSVQAEALCDIHAQSARTVQPGDPSGTPLAFTADERSAVSPTRRDAIPRPIDRRSWRSVADGLRRGGPGQTDSAVIRKVDRPTPLSKLGIFKYPLYLSEIEPGVLAQSPCGTTDLGAGLRINDTGLLDSSGQAVFRVFRLSPGELRPDTKSDTSQAPVPPCFCLSPNVPNPF